METALISDLTARILIADDHELVRETLACFLVKTTGMQIEQTRSLDDTLKLIDAEGPFELVLLDLSMPGMTMPNGLKKCLDANAPYPVAILTGTASQEVEYSTIFEGAAGFFSKSLAPDELVVRIRAILEGKHTTIAELDTRDSIQQRTSRTSPMLTQRERDVLLGICEGKSNKEIAQDLDVQEVTVKLHVKTLSRKLDARNRTHAAMLAHELHLI
jgi:two-component system, NarL family, nitrate/nitrite response regulator NarL